MTHPAHACPRHRDHDVPISHRVGYPQPMSAPTAHSRRASTSSRGIWRCVVDGAVHGRPVCPRRGCRGDRPTEAQGRRRGARFARHRVAWAVDCRGRAPLYGGRVASLAAASATYRGLPVCFLLPAPRAPGAPERTAARMAHWPSITSPDPAPVRRIDPFLDRPAACGDALTAARRARNVASLRAHAPSPCSARPSDRAAAFILALPDPGDLARAAWCAGSPRRRGAFTRAGLPRESCSASQRVAVTRSRSVVGHETRDPTGRPGRRIGREIAPVDLVHRRELVHVDEVDGRLDDVLVAQADRREQAPDVVEHRRRLSRDPAGTGPSVPGTLPTWPATKTNPFASTTWLNGRSLATIPGLFGTVFGIVISSIAHADGPSIGRVAGVHTLGKEAAPGRCPAPSRFGVRWQDRGAGPSGRGARADEARVEVDEAAGPSSQYVTPRRMPGRSCVCEVLLSGPAGHRLFLAAIRPESRGRAVRPPPDSIPAARTAVRVALEHGSEREGGFGGRGSPKRSLVRPRRVASSASDEPASLWSVGDSSSGKRDEGQGARPFAIGDRLSEIRRPFLRPWTARRLTGPGRTRRPRSRPRGRRLGT